MIDFDKLKIVLFDFDDTLCIHNHNNWNCTNIEFETGLLLKTFNWCGSSYNIHLKKFIQLCKSSNIRMGLLGHVSSVTEATAKIKWVKENYEIELENYCVGAREYKVIELESIMIANNLDYKELLIVDDLLKTLLETSEKGFQSATPMEVVNYIENKQKQLVL